MTALSSSMGFPFSCTTATLFPFRQREEVKPLFCVCVNDALQVAHAFLLEHVETVEFVQPRVGPVRAAANVAEAVLSVKHQCAGQDGRAGPGGEDHMAQGKVLRDTKKSRALARLPVG